MKVLATSDPGTGELEKYRAKDKTTDWQLAISGEWSQSPYHYGNVSYFICNPKSGLWVMDRVQRNSILDDVTEEDVEEGRLNDDQIQAMWGMTLDEAQEQSYKRIVAVGMDIPEDINATMMAEILYKAVIEKNGIGVEISDGNGLLDE